MANLIREQKLIDGTKRTLLKYVFVADGTPEANTILVDASNLAYALNANGYIMVGGVHPKSSYRSTLKRIYGTAKSNGYFKLQWAGDANSEIVTFGGGQFNYDFESMGDGAVITNPEANATGDILLTTRFMSSQDAFTLFIDLRKNNADYDAGQTADPTAFNRGPAAP